MRPLKEEHTSLYFTCVKVSIQAEVHILRDISCLWRNRHLCPYHTIGWGLTTPRYVV